MLFLEKPKYRHTGNILTVVSVQSRNIERARACKIRQFHDVCTTTHQLRWERNLGKSLTLICSVLALLIALTIAPTVVLAGGGNVLPGPAKPRSYSLSDMARATAFLVKGRNDPSSRFGQFEQHLERARIEKRCKRIKKLDDDKDWRGTWKPLMNECPEQFRERVVQEVGGIGVGPT